MKLKSNSIPSEGSILTKAKPEEIEKTSNCAIPVKTIPVLLTGILLALFLFHLISLWLVDSDRGPTGPIMKFNHYFNFNSESNFPTLFSAFILLFASLLLWIIYQLTEPGNRYRRRWILLSAIFLFLSLDEAVRIHEQIEILTRRIFTNDMSGFLKMTWTIPYVLFALTIAVYNYRFVLQLPNLIRKKFLLSGGLYVLAAAGTESLEGYLMQSTAGNRNVLITTITIQEFFEMASIILFISALLDYLSMKFKNINLRLEGRAPSARANNQFQ